MLFKKTTLLLALLIPGFLSATVLAAETGDTRTSKSISYTTAEADKTSRDTQLEQADTDIMGPLIQEGFRAESSTMTVSLASFSYNNTGDITLYDASTQLISDFDYDGFYHRFSIAIDADTIYHTAYIYARLYLSYEGGPWNHYATSENYHIYGDSELDTFVIETELADGFAPGYYDVRIELYDADYDEWLLSYGPYDDVSLSALPLEDSYHDDDLDTFLYPVETEIVVAAHGGSMSWWLLVVLAALIAVTRLSAKRFVMRSTMKLGRQ